jgi:hypothetical protein
MATETPRNDRPDVPDMNTDPTLIAQARGRIPDSVNFDRIDQHRQMYLNEQAMRYIRAGDTDPTTPAPSLDYNSFAGILNHLSGRNDLNDLERAFVWSSIADRKGQADNWQNRFVDGDYSIALNGSKDEIRDSQPFRDWNTPNHSVLSFRDGYHGFGNPHPGESQSLAYLSRDEANRRIRDHESILGVNLNEGDIQASTRLVAAFRQYREADWGSKFESFASEWQIQMLETRGQDARDIGQRFSDLGGRAEPEWLRDLRQNNRSEAPGVEDGNRSLYADASNALRNMPGYEQLALNTQDSRERLGMLLQTEMNGKGVVQPNYAFTSDDRSRVFASEQDPRLPQTQVASATVQDANTLSTQQAHAQLNQSAIERDARQNNALAQQPSQDVEQNRGVPSHGARA